MIRHTGIVVGDIEKSIDFYSENFNLVVMKDMMERGSYIDNMLGIKDVSVRTVKLADTEGGLIELLKFEDQPQAPNDSRWGLIDFGCSHMAFTVPDTEVLYTRLQEDGCINISRPQEPPGGKVKVFFSQTPKEFGGIFLEIVEEL
tara:strand:- start:734 stop:1168 length:435 start_codon:yes stop_codon:yes gene_type:complete